MGSGKSYSLHEIDDTRKAGRDDAFEEIIQKIIAAGGKIESDETTPLYEEIGMEEAETGTQRVVEFSLPRNDFQLTRRVIEKRITGDGRNKSLEPLASPIIKISLKKKPSDSDTWQIVDVDELF